MNRVPQIDSEDGGEPVEPLTVSLNGPGEVDIVEKEDGNKDEYVRPSHPKKAGN